MRLKLVASLLPLFAVISTTFAFATSRFVPSSRTSIAAMTDLPSHLVDPNTRDSQYQGNMAQYLVDLHDNKATFDFCGGMMFQLVLSDALRSYLETIAKESGSSSGSNPNKQPKIFDASKRRMNQIPNYKQTGEADNVHVFHGREIRQVPDAAGGMGFVLQLSLANQPDPEGWTAAEINGYDGWGHDSGRVWRNGDRLEQEGFTNFRTRFGPKSFALHHRFYLHFDGQNRMWLSAEDGCEGTPSQVGGANKSAFSPLYNLFGQS